MALLPRRLRPKGHGDFSVESFDAWTSRLGDQLPSNVPRDLLESWLYRHWDQVQGDLEWLPLKKLRFEERGLTDQEILTLRFRDDEEEDWLVHWGEQFLIPKTSHNTMWIGQQIMELRTYPVRPPRAGPDRHLDVRRVRAGGSAVPRRRAHAHGIHPRPRKARHGAGTARRLARQAVGVPAMMVKCTKCDRGFDAVGAEAKKAARAVKAGDGALSVPCPFCEQLVMVLVGEAEDETSLRCPVPGCAGFVNFIAKSRKSAAFWGCGECGSIWREVKNLHREITAIVKRFPYRKQSYKKAGGAWVPGRDPPSVTARIGREPREADREYERD